jgi:hypothetical protein
MYALVEMNEDGTVYKVLKKSYNLLDLSHSSFDGESYPSVLLSREDLLSVLEDQIEDNEEDETRIEKRVDEMWERIKTIPDEDMIRLASKLGEALVGNGGYWDYLEDWLNERGFTVEKNEEQ